MIFMKRKKELMKLGGCWDENIINLQNKKLEGGELGRER